MPNWTDAITRQKISMALILQSGFRGGISKSFQERFYAWSRRNARTDGEGEILHRTMRTESKPARAIRGYLHKIRGLGAICGLGGSDSIQGCTGWNWGCESTWIGGGDLSSPEFFFDDLNHLYWENGVWVASTTQILKLQGLVDFS